MLGFMAIGTKTSILGRTIARGIYKSWTRPLGNHHKIHEIEKNRQERPQRDQAYSKD